MKNNKNYKIGIIGLGYVGFSLFQSIKKKNFQFLDMIFQSQELKQ